MHTIVCPFPLCVCALARFPMCPQRTRPRPRRSVSTSKSSSALHAFSSPHLDATEDGEDIHFDQIEMETEKLAIEEEKKSRNMRKRTHARRSDHFGSSSRDDRNPHLHSSDEAMDEDEDGDNASGTSDEDEILQTGAEGEDNEDEELREELEAYLRLLEQGKKQNTKKGISLTRDGDEKEEAEELSSEQKSADSQSLPLSSAQTDRNAAVATQKKTKVHVLDHEMLRQRFQALAFQVEGVSGDDLWVESLDCCGVDTPISSRVEDPADDLRREQVFFEDALASVRQGIKRLDELGVKYHRPDDYFAEMVKSDAHMHKIKQRLLAQRSEIEAAEQRRKQRDNKKFGKMVQVRKEQEKSEAKKRSLDEIKRMRQGRREDDPIVAGKRLAEDLSQSFNSKRRKTNDKSVNSKRRYKDEKYGFGGRKRGQNRNTAESASDVSSFSVRRNMKDVREHQSQMKNRSRSGSNLRSGGNQGAKRGAHRPGKVQRARNRG